MTAAWILIVGLGIVLLLPVLARVARHRLDPFEPIMLFVLAWGAMFVVRPAAMLAWDDLTFWGVDVGANLPLVVLLAFVGAVSFIAVYESRAGVIFAARAPRPRPVRSGRMAGGAVATALVGTLALLAFLPLGEGASAFGYLLDGRSDRLGELIHTQSTYLWALSGLFAPAAFLMFMVALRRRTAAAWTLFAIVGTLALLRLAPIGSRGLLLPLAGGALMLVYLHRERRPGRNALIAALAAALLVSYLILFLRYPYSRGETLEGLRAVASDPAAVFRPVLSGADAEMAPALAAALTVVPSELGYEYGRAVLVDLIIRPVPRELWPGKPLTPSREVRVELWPVPVLVHGFDPAFSTLLVFYRDFGVYGVIVGMAGLGLLARALYAYLLRFAASFTVQVLYAVFVWYLAVIVLRDGPVDTLVQAAFFAGPITLVLIFASSPRSEDSLERPRPSVRRKGNFAR